MQWCSDGSYNYYGSYGGGSGGRTGGGSGISNRGVNSIVEVASTVNSTAGPYMSWGGVVGAAAERALLASPGVDAATGVINGVKVVGKGLARVGAGLSIGLNIYEFYQNPTAGNFGRIIISTGIAGIGAIPLAGPILSFGLSLYEANGGFDSLYQWLDKYYPTPLKIPL